MKKLRKDLANAEKGCQDEKDALLKQVDTAEKSRVAAQTDQEKKNDARLRLQSINAKLLERDNKSKVDLETMRTNFQNQLHKEIKELQRHTRKSSAIIKTALRMLPP